MEDKPSIVSKGRYQLKYRGTACLNCGHPLDISDKFFPNCSQMNSIKKPSLKDFFDEFFSSLISYDSKLLKTLSTLLIKPGTISKDYINGKRVSYTNPFRFLLSLAIIYFLISSFNTDFTTFDRFIEENKDEFIKDGEVNLKYSDKPPIDTSQFTEEELDSINQGLREKLEFKGGPNYDVEQTLRVVDSLDRLERVDSAKQKQNKDSLILADPIGYFKTITDNDYLTRVYHKQRFFYTLAKERGIYRFYDLGDSIPIEETSENKIAFNTGQSMRKLSQQPGAFVQSIISRLPFLIFFFLPVFALAIWLMYVRKKFTYVDHLIFSFHNQSLLFILLIISFIIDSIFDVFSSPIFILIFSVYLYKSMRNFYRQGRFKTIVKYLLLNTIFITLAIISVIGLFTGSALTY